MAVMKRKEGKQNVAVKDLSLCIETASGKLVNPADPQIEDICIEDIAWALSRIPRFAGHTTSDIPYNVAQHSVHVSLLVEEYFAQNREVLFHTTTASTLCMKALFHDAHEAYFGDIPSPIKRITGLTEALKDIENTLDRAIFGAIGIVPYTDTDKLAIKHCDKLAQAIEGRHLMPSKGLSWNLPQPTVDQLMNWRQPLIAADSYDLFLERYRYLGGQ